MSSVEGTMLEKDGIETSSEDELSSELKEDESESLLYLS